MQDNTHHNKDDPLKLLYVEDSEPDVILMQLAIDRSASSVHMRVAQTVSDAIAVFDALHPGKTQNNDTEGEFVAALLDWNLPDGKGTDIAQHIRDHHGNFPIIFMTGVWSNKVHDEAMQYHPLAFLEKKYDSENICKIIELFRNAI